MTNLDFPIKFFNLRFPHRVVILKQSTCTRENSLGHFFSAILHKHTISCHFFLVSTWMPIITNFFQELAIDCIREDIIDAKYLASPRNERRSSWRPFYLTAVITVSIFEMYTITKTTTSRLMPFSSAFWIGPFKMGGPSQLRLQWKWNERENGPHAGRVERHRSPRNAWISM